MKKLIPVTFLLLTFFTSNAQFENIDLSKYKLPEIKRHQLDLNFSYNNSFSKNSYEEIAKNSYFDLYNRIDASYSFYKNTKFYQRNVWTRMFSKVQLDWEKQDNANYDKNDDYYWYLQTGFENRYYPQESRWFFHIAPEANYSISNDYSKQSLETVENYDVKYFYNNMYFSPEMKIGGGIGRIEPVGDLRRAIYILDDLLKNERLNRIPNESEIYLLANKIAYLRNQRFFDSRLRSKYEIQSLDSTLTDLGLVNGMDAIYFTSINDMWSFSQEERYSGNRLQFDAIGGLNYSWNKAKRVDLIDNSDNFIQTDKLKQFPEILGVQVLFESYKPLGLKWQRYISFETSFKNIFVDKKSYIHNYNTLDASFTYRYDWFMNTRTYANFGFYSNFNRFDHSSLDEYYYDINKINLSLFGNIHYYFSPRLRASLNVSLYYNWTDNLHTSYTRQFQISNQIAFSYAIF